jgi:hypothetical protein
VQGFPSLFNYQNNLFEKFKNHYPFLNDSIHKWNYPEQYLQILEDAICNNHPKENVILLEIEPKQNTKIDYYQTDIGIPIVCITELVKKKKQLFYEDDNGNEILVKRIYNRVILMNLICVQI